MPNRLVFMGSDPIALPALEWMAGAGRSTAEIVGVFTQPDRPHGRGQHLTPNAIKQWAMTRGIPVYQPEKLTARDLDDFRALAPDAALVMAYGHILRQDWLDAPPHGVWNLHASLLPKFRGASPIVGAIAAGEVETGVCLMRMVLRLDAGPVLDAERVAVAPLDTAATLGEKIAQACVPLMERNLVRLFTPDVPLRDQEEAAATFTRRLRKEDGRLDFHAPAGEIARRINALFPWPGAVVVLHGETVRIGLADAAPASASVSAERAEVMPGTVLDADDEALVVAAGEGSVRLRRLQRPGGRMLAASDFLRGRPVPPGTLIVSEPMPPLVATRPFKG